MAYVKRYGSNYSVHSKASISTTVRAVCSESWKHRIRPYHKMIWSVCALKLNGTFSLVASRTKGLAQVGVTGTSLLTCHRLHGTANKREISPATLQMTELWVYSVFHAAKLNILVYSSSYFWHGFHTEEVRSLPSSHLPRDSKIYLALNLRFSLVHRNLSPYSCSSAQSTHGVLCLQRTLEFIPTFWSCFQKFS